MADDGDRWAMVVRTLEFLGTRVFESDARNLQRAIPMNRKRKSEAPVYEVRSRSVWRHLPNLLSASRVALIPLIVWLSLNHHHLWALVVFCFCALTDLLDGFLAQRFGWSTRFGTLLDPVADRIFVFSLIPLLWYMDSIDGAYTLLVVARFSIQLSAFPVLLWWMKKQVHVVPGLLSKVAMTLAFLVLGMGFAQQVAIELLPADSGADEVFDRTIETITLVGCLLEVWVLVKFVPRYWNIIRGRADTIV